MGRLQRTSGFIATTTSGTIADVSVLIRTINGVHRSVVGVEHRGRPYDARDPNLLRWVFILDEPPVGWTDKPVYTLLRHGAVAATL